MPFWKKGEDPWDLDPAKRRELIARETEEQGPAGSATGLERGAKSGEGPETGGERPGPHSLPLVREHNGSQISLGRQRLFGKGKAGPFSGGLFDEKWNFLDEGDLISGSYKTVWYCKDCRKLAADLPPEPYGLTAEAAPEQTREEQREGEQ